MSNTVKQTDSQISPWSLVQIQSLPPRCYDAVEDITGLVRWMDRGR